MTNYSSGWVCHDLSRENTLHPRALYEDPNADEAGLSTKTLHASIHVLTVCPSKHAVLECTYDKGGLDVALRLVRGIGFYAVAPFIINARAFNNESSRTRMYLCLTNMMLCTVTVPLSEWRHMLLKLSDDLSPITVHEVISEPIKSNHISAVKDEMTAASLSRQPVEWGASKIDMEIARHTVAARSKIPISQVTCMNYQLSWKPGFFFIVFQRWRPSNAPASIRPNVSCKTCTSNVLDAPVCVHFHGASGEASIALWPPGRFLHPRPCPPIPTQDCLFPEES